MSHNKFSLREIQESLNPYRIKALLGFQAFSGWDQTEIFHNLSKNWCWETLLCSTNDVLNAFCRVGSDECYSEADLTMSEKFVLILNCKNSFPAYVKTLADLIWLMFSKNKSDSAKAPPISSTLKENNFRVHYITIQWKSAHISTPSLLDPNDYSWLFNEKGSSIWNCHDVFGTTSRIHYLFDRM